MQNLQDEVAKYKRVAIEYEDACLRYDADDTNRAHDQLIHVLLRIRGLTQGALGVLRPLLNHPHKGVRRCAAWHLLWEYEDEAVSTLNDLAQIDERNQFEVEMLLSEWRKRNLKPPWEWES